MIAEAAFLIIPGMAAGVVPLACTALASRLSGNNPRFTIYFGYIFGFATSIIILSWFNSGDSEFHVYTYLATFILSHIYIISRYAIRKKK